MGWSRPWGKSIEAPCRVQGREALARRSALSRINYRGHLTMEGDPLEGRGTAVRRGFHVGARPRWVDIADTTLTDLAEQARDGAEFGGGYRYSGYDDTDDSIDAGVAWPVGYERDDT